MKNTIAFIGFGDLGIHTHHVLKNSNLVYDRLVVFDDTIHSDTYNFVDEVFPFMDYKKEEYADFQFVIALGYKHLELKYKIYNELLDQNKALPNIIHKNCYITEEAVMGQGNVFHPMVHIDINTTIGNVNVFNSSTVISHDIEISDCNFFAASVTISSKVNIGNCNFFGSGSVSANLLSIGNNNVVCVGTVVTKSIKDDSTVVGNPMRTLTKSVKLN